MQHENNSESKHSPHRVAYLVVREGSTKGDVYRLTPGQVVTVGRAPTNKIVIRDEICSRNHCEIFQNDSQWTLRDLDSRNGTRINGSRVVGDRGLEDGELIQIGDCQVGFTHDLSASFSQFEAKDDVGRETETAVDSIFDHPAADHEPEIIHRKRNSRYQSAAPPETIVRDRMSQELAKLYRLALEMGSTRDSKSLSDVVLDGLFSGTCADIGAILLLPKGTTSEAKPERLSVIVYKSPADQPYQKVSDYLSSAVLAKREAILARDVSDDSRLANRDSLGRIHAQSVICAPLRVGPVIYGLIHLYSTNPDNPLDADNLEFTLAVADQLAVVLENLSEKESLAVGLARAQDENQTLLQQLELKSELVGDSRSMQKLRQDIRQVAPTDATVLIRGESGVGKELVARAIHFGSNRRKSPFVCLNCAALSESLLESELFGHEKGSFTGATERKLGKFEQAYNGTLFLDEVGEMGQAIQAKFLRVVEGHPFERVGGQTPVRVNVRVVAATNRNLESAVEQGSFRKDLYFRLQVVEITVDPLREHRSDIVMLANYFLERFSRKTERPVERFTREALDVLMNYDWPGNIRELQNVVERGVILCTGGVVNEADIQLSTLGSKDARKPTEIGLGNYREVSLKVLEREHIMATLIRMNWNKSRTAQILGIERSTLDRKLKRYQVSRPEPE
jgi:Nif-specific regulatory protein